MDERCAQLLNTIISADKSVKISDLAEQFQVSPRTIRYDLDRIDDFLMDNKLPQLMRKPNCGVEFPGPSELKEKALSLLVSIDTYNYVLSPEERQKVILSELFQAKDYMTIEHLAEMLCVSRGSVINDLKKVKGWLKDQNLELESSPRYGIKVLGNEKDLRRVAVNLLTENMEMERALNIIKAPIHRRVGVAVDRQLRKLFEDMDLMPIEEAVRLAEEQLETVFSDGAYSGLVIHLALALKRIQLGKDITMPKEELSGLGLTKEFAVASSMVKRLEESYNVKIPTDEIGYITIHLLGGKVAASEMYMKENWAVLQTLTAKIIEVIQSKLGIHLSEDDELYKGLMEHLGPTIYRLKHGLPLKNPILEEIKTNYEYIFHVVKGGLKALEEYVGTQVPEEEAGYITIHFGAALERCRSSHTRIYRALVVCGTGIGTAKLLSSRLKAEFANIQIVGTIASHQVKEKIFNQDKHVDLIISTVPTCCGSLPEIIVNPLLPPEDVEKINRHISLHPPRSSESEKFFKPSMEEILAIIERYCTIKSRKELISALAEYLKLPLHECSKGVVKPVLKDLLTEKTIKLNVEAKDWEEAVRIGGEILVENGFVEPRYVDAMVRTVKEIGPYIVIVPGIAMPHARPEDGAKQVCMSLITLKEPVNFGNEANDPVKIVVCLGATDHSSHLKALSQLVQLFSDTNQIQEIKDASENTKILDIIETFSEEN